MNKAVRSHEALVKLPTFHADQVEAFWALNDAQYAALRCGRRYGKTAYAGNWAIDGLIKGEIVGWFAPDYKTGGEVFNELVDILDPIKKRSSKTDGIIRTTTGGRMDFWTLENINAGRSRKYHRIIFDEAAFTNDATMQDQWERAIEPTLADYNGRVLACSNTNGVNPDNFFWKLCNDPAFGFTQYHAPSERNPYLSKEFLAKKRANSHPLVWRQEYLAEFVDFSGVAFFPLEGMLVNGQPVEMPVRCNAVFAVVDTAVKTGKDNDGTAVTYFAMVGHSPYPLVILDWDIVQIEGQVLDTWLKTVFARLEELALLCRARAGSLGAHIEDKATGMVLLQQCRTRGWPGHAIDSKLTALGKDERAINASGPYYAGRVKITGAAHDKVTTYKGVTRNHFIAQMTGFRVGDKDAAKRADDLLDTGTYGIAIGLGNSEGF